jgi:hypothetical protein
MKQNNNGMVEMPAVTLNAIKSLLFTDKGGIDLSSIINDLGGSDLTAINVALVYKGAKPQIDTRSRYEWNYGTKYYRYDFVSFSLILNKVECKKVAYNLLESGDAEETGSYDTVIDLQDWLSKTTNAQDIVDIINKRKA